MPIDPRWIGWCAWTLAVIEATWMNCAPQVSWEGMPEATLADLRWDLGWSE